MSLRHDPMASPYCVEFDREDGTTTTTTYRGVWTREQVLESARRRFDEEDEGQAPIVAARLYTTTTIVEPIEKEES